MAVTIIDQPTRGTVSRAASSGQEIPDPSEVATVIVNGMRFVGWESVYVQVRWKDVFPVFQFVVAENDPTPKEFDRLQFKPLDRVTIYLGGELAVTGYILRRQTAYEGQRHGVQFFGVGLQWFAARASIIDKTNNFDKMTLEQVAQKVLAPFEAGLQVVPKLDETPFEGLQVNAGETVFEFLDRAARMRGAILGGDHRGNFLLIGDHNNPVEFNLVEGKNIKSCECVISVEGTRSDFRVWGQRPADDDTNGWDAAAQEAIARGMAMPYSPLLIPIEMPVWSKAEVEKRAQTEAKWGMGTYISVTIVVYGWLRGGRNLWRAGDKVIVNSPMAMLNGVELTIQTATFTQDSESGTLTTLELVKPELLNDLSNLSPGDSWLKAATPNGNAESPQGHQVETAPDAKPTEAAPDHLQRQD
jgi:prophage tail gpP-like protein